MGPAGSAVHIQYRFQNILPWRNRRIISHLGNPRSGYLFFLREYGECA